ncbi:MAG TPA: acylphosphatase [Dehalococcoidia bacterium]|nr:acylphosphatase [Dehalococcoidia bacterium]
MNDPAAISAIVYGRVQGVYYRAFVRRRAAELGLAGYARNLPDGTVEVRAEGEREQLQKLIGHLESGPPAARVAKVVTNWSEYTGDYTGFSVRYYSR